MSGYEEGSLRSPSKPRGEVDLKSFGRVGVLCGGSSNEREISLRSGRAVYQALVKGGVDARLVDLGNGLLQEIEPLEIDIAFIALHGEGGEDGSIQEVLERLGIPYVGSDREASAVAFDKLKAKEIFLGHGIPTPRFCRVEEDFWEEALEEISCPFFVKPACEGSSINVFLIEKRPDAKPIVPPLFKKYAKLIFEEKIFGRELTVGILGKQVLPVIELRPKRSFFDFEAKYTPGLTEYLIPAEISPRLVTKVQAIALQAHQALGLRDFSRMDLILSRDTPYVLEANSIPGLTEMSLLPKAARAAGIEFPELCFKLLDLARERSNGFVTQTLVPSGGG